MASGRNPAGRSLPPEQLAAAVTDLDVDVLCLQEVDVGQPRSSRANQARVVADALGAAHWRFAPTLAGVPGPWRMWHPALPVALAAAAAPGPPDCGRPLFGNAIVSRRSVRRWHVLALGSGRAHLPVKAPDPRTGTARWWWIPDEPRVALAAELDGVTVVCTHLSFSPATALRQIRWLRRWSAALPGRIVVAGDLNLPGRIPAAVLSGTGLVSAPTYPADSPRLQLDHIVALRRCAAAARITAAGEAVRRLPVGDHRGVIAVMDC